MMPISASLANSSGAKSTSAFHVESGGGKAVLYVVAAAGLVLVVVAFLFLRRK